MLLLPLVGRADLLMCVDPQTGATSFTDKACQVTASQQEIKVNTVNPGGSQQASRHPERNKAWRSQLDVRKTGTDFNSERRALYRSEASAPTN